jgi:hypothetical protein
MYRKMNPLKVRENVWCKSSQTFCAWCPLEQLKKRPDLMGKLVKFTTLSLSVPMIYMNNDHLYVSYVQDYSESIQHKTNGKRKQISMGMLRSMNEGLRYPWGQA